MFNRKHYIAQPSKRWFHRKKGGEILCLYPTPSYHQALNSLLRDPKIWIFLLSAPIPYTDSPIKHAPICCSEPMVFLPLALLNPVCNEVLTNFLNAACLSEFNCALIYSNSQYTKGNLFILLSSGLWHSLHKYLCSPGRELSNRLQDCCYSITCTETLYPLEFQGNVIGYHGEPDYQATGCFLPCQSKWCSSFS